MVGGRGEGEGGGRGRKGTTEEVGLATKATKSCPVKIEVTDEAVS